MHLGHEKDVEILLAALSERYEAMRVIRKRIQDTSLWILGLLLGASSWLVTSSVVLTCTEKGMFILALVVSFIVLRFLYFDDLARGFRAQQRVAAEIEGLLGFFTPGRFGEATHQLYPAKWSRAGTDEGAGRFVKASYALIYVATGLLLATIIFKGALF